MIDYKKALELKKEGMTLKDIMRRLKLTVNDRTYATFRKGLFRFERDIKSKNSEYEPKADEGFSSLKGEILRYLKSGSNLTTLSEKLKLSERIVKAYIEELIEDGFNILEVDGTYTLIKVPEQKVNKVTRDWQGNKVIRFGIVSDTHMGSKYTQMTFLRDLYDLFEKEGLDTVYHAGDISEGNYTNRPGHIYEVCAHGFDQQKDYIIKKYPHKDGIKTYYICGNHDKTHMMNGGADIGKAIEREREDMIFLGWDNAQIELTPNCILELNHPGDGASYAISYSLQKYMDSITGGDKPSILVNGHHHKAMSIFYRNIHAMEGGSVQAQTPFMRGKKLAAHVGAYICTVHVDDEGTVVRFLPEFIPLYKILKDDY